MLILDVGLVLYFSTGLDALEGSKIYLTALTVVGESLHHTAVIIMMLVSGVQVSQVNNFEQNWQKILFFFMYTLAPFPPDNCTEGTIRLLYGSTTRTGTVQVCVNRTWGSICDSGWSSQDATVVCRQLGFPTLGKVNCMCLVRSITCALIAQFYNLL